MGEGQIGTFAAAYFVGAVYRALSVSLQALPCLSPVDAPVHPVRWCTQHSFLQS
jgi:hypothetical protein